MGFKRSFGNLVFLADLQTNVQFYQVNASSVTDCSFVGLPGHSLSIYGIKDIGTHTGNRFVNDTFDCTQAIALSLGGGPVFTNLVLVSGRHRQRKRRRSKSHLPGSAQTATSRKPGSAQNTKISSTRRGEETSVSCVQKPGRPTGCLQRPSDSSARFILAS
jgi:hypothetical protein